MDGQTGGSIKLEDGARVAVMGGGPAGALFSYFLLDLAGNVGLTLEVDIYEPRDFSVTGPPGCNMCAGIISETLVQNLAVEGIALPPTVVQRSMDTYFLHTGIGNACLESPNLERRIGAVYRGAGPLGMKGDEWQSFDLYLLKAALGKGAHHIRQRVEDVSRSSDGLTIYPRGGPAQEYDFLAVATGVNTRVLKLFEPIDPGFEPPKTAQTHVREYYLGSEVIAQHLGNHTIHFFFLDQPGLDFAAIVPKGNYVTVCGLGESLGAETFDEFLDSPIVKACMPPGWEGAQFVCHCSPRINIAGAIQPYGERLLFLGDCGISRLYKDGIGAAYQGAKFAATTVVFQGISREELRQHYWHRYRRMERDNRLGKLIFVAANQLKRRPFATVALVDMLMAEQNGTTDQRRMSRLIWDMFTGSSPYEEIVRGSLHPAFLSRFLWHVVLSLLGRTVWKPAH